jgi:hypothetical protein
MLPCCCVRSLCAGTREQCLSALECGVGDGLSCVIDRCNVDTEQRAPFIQLAASLGCQVHCVVLDQPLKLCIQRAQARTDHPSGVMGPAAAGIVSRFRGSLTSGKLVSEGGWHGGGSHKHASSGSHTITPDGKEPVLHCTALAGSRT